MEPIHASYKNLYSRLPSSIRHAISQKYDWSVYSIKSLKFLEQKVLAYENKKTRQKKEKMEHVEEDVGILVHEHEKKEDEKMREEFRQRLKDICSEDQHALTTEQARQSLKGGKPLSFAQERDKNLLDAINMMCPLGEPFSIVRQGFIDNVFPPRNHNFKTYQAPCCDKHNIVVYPNEWQYLAMLQIRLNAQDHYYQKILSIRHETGCMTCTRAHS